MSDTFKRLGTVTHKATSPYLSPSEGFLKGERIPPGTFRVAHGDDVITFELRGEEALTNSVYIPEVRDWPSGEYELEVLWEVSDE